MKSKSAMYLVVINLIFSGFLFYKLNTKEIAFESLKNKIIKVRGVIVVDSLGVERAILGAHLPEAQRNGGRQYSSRSQSGISGLMLYDSEGLERGGYVTDDNYGNIFLTLDSKDEQTALFLAEPQGATTMSVFSRKGSKASFTASDDKIVLDIQENGKPVKIRNND